MLDSAHSTRSITTEYASTTTAALNANHARARRAATVAIREANPDTVRASHQIVLGAAITASKATKTPVCATLRLVA
jgi:hypothetical protein